ncbi:MAG: glycosyltransferase family 4 protein, partial [Acidimicrobiia bacterium]
PRDRVHHSVLALRAARDREDLGPGPVTGNQRLRVAIDGTPLVGERTGIGHFTADLIDHLAARDDIEVVAYAVTWRGRHKFADLLPKDVRAGTAPIPARVARAVWERTPRMQIERWTGPVDVVHATNFVGPPAKAPVLLTIHDLGFMLHPDWAWGDARGYPEWVTTALKRGAMVHVPSDFVGAQAQEVFALPAERVTRVYLGLGPIAEGNADAGRELAGASTYVLALGQIEPRKNLPGLVRGFDRVAATNPDLSLVVAGPDGVDRPAFEAAIAAAHHGDRVRWIRYVPNNARGDLLAGAAAFAYPSRYEGFGFPPLEAMRAGVPVVATKTGSLPEVLGDAALLTPVEDDDALAAALDRLLRDDELRANLVRRGAAQAAKFGWPRAVSEFADLYRRVAATG